MALMKSEKESGHIKDNCCLQFLKIKTKISDVNVIINFDILALLLMANEQVGCELTVLSIEFSFWVFHD